MKVALLATVVSCLLLAAEGQARAHVRARRRKDKQLRGITQDKLPAGKQELLAAGFEPLISTPPLNKKPAEQIAALAAQAAAKKEESFQYWGPLRGGPGSSKEQSVMLISIVRTVVNMLGLTSMVDAACGTLEWAPSLLQALEEDVVGFRYYGVDISPSVIKANQERYTNYTRWDFAVKDISKDPIPKSYDLVFSRDVLQHLPCEAIVAALRLFSESDARYLLVGSYEADRNREIRAGEYFDIDLRKPPFKLTEVVRVFNEHTRQVVTDVPDKYVLLYDMKYIRKQNFAVMKDMCSLLVTA